MKNILTSSLFRGISYGLILVIFIIAIVFFDSPSRYSISEQYTFSSPVRSRIALAILLPGTQAYQEIKNLKVEEADKFDLRDTAGLQVVSIESTVDKDKTILITFDVLLQKGSLTWKGITTTGDIAPQTGIESDNPELMAKSISITNGQDTRDARMIYDFVSTWLKWPKGNRLGDSSSAMMAFRQKVGVCSDFARLTTAMLRACGIPARSIVGLAMPQYINFRQASEWNHQAQSHAWVEFYADGQWHFADPSWGGNSHFNNCDGFHLSYGEEQTERNVYANCNRRISSVLNSGTGTDTNFAVIGAMSAPLKFIAAAENSRVKLTPKGMISIRYGYRLPALIILVFLMVVFELLVRRKHISP